MPITEPTPLSSTDLRRVLSKLFDDEELRILCHDLGADYDDLRGDSRKAKALSLVIFMEERGRLPELEAAVRCERPELDTTYSHQRVQELQASILSASRPNVRDAFIEFTQQIEAYLYEFNSLHEQLEEWKEVHNLLQDLQFNFASCRSYVFTLGRLEGLVRTEQRQWERILYEVEVEWRPCKRSLRKLQELAVGIQTIGKPYEPESDSGPDWFLAPKRIEANIDSALFSDDLAALAEHLSAFGDQVDYCLYQADRALRDVVAKINRLPHPGSYAVRSQ